MRCSRVGESTWMLRPRTPSTDQPAGRRYSRTVTIVGAVGGSSRRPSPYLWRKPTSPVLASTERNGSATSSVMPSSRARNSRAVATAAAASEGARSPVGVEPLAGAWPSWDAPPGAGWTATAVVGWVGAPASPPGRSARVRARPEPTATASTAPATSRATGRRRFGGRGLGGRTWMSSRVDVDMVPPPVPDSRLPLDRGRPGSRHGTGSGTRGARFGHRLATLTGCGHVLIVVAAAHDRSDAPDTLNPEAPAEDRAPTGDRCP